MQAYETEITVLCRRTLVAVSKEIEGDYIVISMNHNRPVYQKNNQSASRAETVILFFWDTRDGIFFHGWWFGRRLGDFSSRGPQVYNPEVSTVQPPTFGWVTLTEEDVLNLAGGSKTCITIRAKVMEKIFNA